jgi:two-component system NtrC family response regulator
MKPHILIVDDDEGIRSQMKWALADDYQVVQAEDRPSALEAFKQHHPLIILLDLGLPPHAGDSEEGFAILNELLAVDPLAKVIIVTGQSDRDKALNAIGKGAYDFLCKPLQMEELKIILSRAFHIANLEREYREIQNRHQNNTFEGMLGTSQAMLDVFNTIRKVATSDAPVLITGESGTGKEMAALAIHRRSLRKDGPFIPINCAAIPETLLESELFGHEKGSFTGAHTQRSGRIETADKGTLFLDEIGDLPLLLQVKLLRFLQEQTIERIGGRKTIHIDTRVVAATNVDLKQAIANGKFREDLFYRLAVVVLKIPPLRERTGEIPVLAKAFLQEYATKNKKNVTEFNRSSLVAMQQYDWPGNVRELDNRIKRAVIMAEGKQVTMEDLEMGTEAQGATGPKSLKDAREEVERQMIIQALERHKGKISPAATDLGISRPAFYDIMTKFGIQRPDKVKE